MTKKLLIDAAIQEETRLVVLQGQHVEVFETETQTEIKGNIYLARVTRVEPSLQAAFIDYGGNRHGFLAFGEIHTDYFQIPAADRASEEGALAQEVVQPLDESVAAPADASISEPASAPINSMEDLIPAESDYYNLDSPKEEPQNNQEENTPSAQSTQSTQNSGKVETVTSAKLNLYKKYNIQEVIKRGQILLVQIVKEERGNKGAALTTFLSLAGRYCVLMPNSESGGGVSRKVSYDSRSKIRDIVEELDVPQGMSLIVRTAGAQQAKTEIERDFEYLTRLWESVRALTLESIAPKLIYEEGNLVQRALRDFIKKDVKEIRIEGSAAYESAKKYMEQLMPAELCLLDEHKEAQPIFVRYGVEALLDDMLQPTVQLKSGGYIVINPTEALVAIDVNSGKATSAHNIEDTALKTNLEATDEIARQARLRDLGGLIVVDFIDMENSSNVREVERRMRDAVRHDRAKVQTGRISSGFGLLEMSRQRLSPEISEGRTEPCEACTGSGQVLTPQTIALRALREGIALANKSGKNQETTLRLNWPVVLYLLNERKDELLRIEQEQGIRLKIEAGGIDNPNKPWVIETKKREPVSAEESNNNGNAVSMETAYTQMAPPSPEAYEPKPQQQQRPRKQRHRPRQKRYNNSQGNNQRQGNNQSQGQGNNQGQGQGQAQQSHRNKNQRGQQKPAVSKKPSLLKKLFGKK